MAKLGRGLSSLLGSSPSTPTDAPRSPLKTIPVDNITPNPRQPRRQFDEDALRALSDNVKANGLLQPILVRAIGDRFELIAGERRWRAAKLAGMANIPAIEQIADDSRSLELAVIENVLRDDLNPLELATAYRELANTGGLTQDQVADKVGKSRPAVANTLRLLDLPPAIQDLVRSGQLSPGHARALLALQDPKRQLALAHRAVKEGLSVRQVERLVYSLPKSRPESKTVTLRAPHITHLERLLSERLGTKVTVHEDRTKGRGQITIEFYTNADFERILQVLGIGQA
jgi:ParB family chromosome partitioning protein